MKLRAVTDYAAQLRRWTKMMQLQQGLYQADWQQISMIKYIEELKKQVLHRDSIDKRWQESLKSCTTPLHGTGNIPARRVLKELGFKNVYVVPEQELPDGDFPTVSYPNPEAAEAFELSTCTRQKSRCRSRPCNRPGCRQTWCLCKRYQDQVSTLHLTGNMSGCLLADYEISQSKETKGLPDDGKFIKTIVTSNLADAIAKYYGVELVEVLNRI